MNSDELQSALHRIESETDPNVRALLLAAVVSEAFRAEGFEPVVVGGSAIEFYTDGAYMSGDVDICWTGLRIPTPADQGRVMASLGAPRGGPRSWKWAGHFFDLLGPADAQATDAGGSQWMARSGDPVRKLESQELGVKLQEALNQLPEKQRQAIVMFTIQEMPQKQVAEVLECSVEAVKWHVFQGRKKLKEMLKEQM